MWLLIGFFGTLAVVGLFNGFWFPAFFIVFVWLIAQLLKGMGLT